MFEGWFPFKDANDNSKNSDNSLNEDEHDDERDPEKLDLIKELEFDLDESFEDIGRKRCEKKFKKYKGCTVGDNSIFTKYPRSGRVTAGIG